MCVSGLVRTERVGDSRVCSCKSARDAGDKLEPWGQLPWLLILNCLCFRDLLVLGLVSARTVFWDIPLRLTNGLFL